MVKETIKIEDILVGKINGIVAGIYMISEGDRVYIGSANGEPSNGIMKRFTNWKWKIENGKTKYFDDISKVRFEILEIVPNDMSDDELSELEMRYWEYVKRVGFELINRNQTVAVRHSVKDTSNMKKAQAGQNNPRARLKDEDVMEILWLRENGYKTSEIAEIYNINKNYVCGIGKRRWQHVNKMIKPEWAEIREVI